MKPVTLEQEIAREQKKAKSRAARKPPLEDTQQIDFIAWARKHAELVWHTPNARKYSRAAWAYWNAMGVEPGILDIFLLIRGVRMAIEFKRPGEKPTAKQRRVGEILARYGYEVAFVYSSEEAKNFVMEKAR